MRLVGTLVWSAAEVASASRLLATESVEHIPDPKEPPPVLSLKHVQSSIKAALGTQERHRESKFFTTYWKNVVRLNSKITKTNRQLSHEFDPVHQPSPPVTPTSRSSGRRGGSALQRTGSQNNDRDVTIDSFTTNIMDKVTSTMTAVLERQQQSKEASRVLAQNEQSLTILLAAKDKEHLAALQAQQVEQRSVERTSAMQVQNLQSEVSKLAADKFDKIQADLIQERKDRENDRDKASIRIQDQMSAERAERKERDEAQAKRDAERDAAQAKRDADVIKERTRMSDFLMEQSVAQQKLMGGLMLGMAFQGRPTPDVGAFFQSTYPANLHANIAHVAHASLQPQALLTKETETSPASSQLRLTDASPSLQPQLTQAAATPVAKPFTANQTACLEKMTVWLETNEVGFDDDVLKGLITMGSGCGADILLLDPENWKEIGFKPVAVKKLAALKEKAKVG